MTTTEQAPKPMPHYAVMNRKSGIQLGPTFDTAHEANAYRASNYPGARIADIRTGRTIKPRDAESADAADRLRNILTPGDTIFTVLRHVSRSGMVRHIDMYLLTDGEPQWITGLASLALGWARHGDYLKVEGCGMDIGFHAIYALSRTLWPDGHPCTGPGTDGHWRTGCPSNDHTNERYGESSYSPERIHADGGYALRYRWL